MRLLLLKFFKKENEGFIGKRHWDVKMSLLELMRGEVKLKHGTSSDWPHNSKKCFTKTFNIGKSINTYSIWVKSLVSFSQYISQQ